MTEVPSLNLNKDGAGRRRTERTQENINIFQEKLIDDLIISARRNGLDISESTFNRLIKSDPYKMHVRKERNIN